MEKLIKILGIRYFDLIIKQSNGLSNLRILPFRSKIHSHRIIWMKFRYEAVPFSKG